MLVPACGLLPRRLVVSVGHMLAAEDLGLIMDKTVKLEWHKLANTRTRCLRITQVGSCAAHCSDLCHRVNCCATLRR